MSPEILRLNYEMLAPADARQAVHDALRLYKDTCWCGLTPYKTNPPPTRCDTEQRAE